MNDHALNVVNKMMELAEEIKTDFEKANVLGMTAEAFAKVGMIDTAIVQANLAVEMTKTAEGQMRSSSESSNIMDALARVACALARI